MENALLIHMFMNLESAQRCARAIAQQGYVVIVSEVGNRWRLEVYTMGAGMRPAVVELGAH